MPLIDFGIKARREAAELQARVEEMEAVVRRAEFHRANSYTAEKTLRAHWRAADAALRNIADQATPRRERHGQAHGADR